MPGKVGNTQERREGKKTERKTKEKSECCHYCLAVNLPTDQSIFIPRSPIRPSSPALSHLSVCQSCARACSAAPVMSAVSPQQGARTHTETRTKCVRKKSSHVYACVSTHTRAWLSLTSADDAFLAVTRARPQSQELIAGINSIY